MPPASVTMFSLAAIGAALAASPVAAVTYVHFAFTAGGTPVHGTYTLDCPPGSGPCAVVALTGTFGATPITLASPPSPTASPAPDDLVNRPAYTPTANGVDFWPVPTLGPDDWKIWESIAREIQMEDYVHQFVITDYVAYVPEPATWTMMLVGVFAAGAALRRRRAAHD